MTTAPEAKGIYVTQELTESEPMIEEQSTSRLCHVHRKEYSWYDVNLIHKWSAFEDRTIVLLLLKMDE